MGNGLGELIRRRRRELGLTQDQLGKRVGKSQVAVSEWERGAVVPSDFPRLARALGMPETDLAVTLAADVLEADEVETAILKQDLIPMNVRHSLVTLYKEILGKYTSGQAGKPV